MSPFSSLARLLLSTAAALSVLMLTGCGPQGDNTPAVSVLGIINQTSVLARPVINLQVEEVSRPAQKTASYTYTATGLPPGIGINADSGLISGTPTAAGAFPVTVTVANTKGKSSRQFTWTVIYDGFAIQRVSAGIRLEAVDTTTANTRYWCFKEVAGPNPAIPATPASDDGCWQTNRIQTVSNNGLTPLYVMWTVDSSGNISQPISGPCSTSLRQKAAEGADPRTVVCVQTSLGELAIDIDAVNAPLAGAQFIAHTNAGFYDGTAIHRVFPNAISPQYPFAFAQGGAFVYSGATFIDKQSPFPALAAPFEYTLKNDQNTVSLMVSLDANSNTLQFLGGFSINFANNPCLNQNDANCTDTAQSPPLPVFGRIVYGADTTVPALRNLSLTTTPWGELSQPQSPPVIYGAYRIR